MSATVTSGPYGTGQPTISTAVIPDDRRTQMLNRVSWGAILAGLVTALVVQVLLNLLGIGIGLSSVSAVDTANNASASGFSMTAGIWWTVSGILASFAGGAVAGRLCGAALVNTARWHGFVTWAAATLVLFWLLTTALGGVLSGAFSALRGTVQGVGGAASTLATGAGNAAGMVDGSGLEQQIKSLINPNDAQNVQSHLTSYLRASISGDTAAADKARDQAVDGLAKTANVSPEEAKKRLAEVEQQARAAAEKVKQQATDAAEAARKGAAQAGIFGTIALLLGALAAWIGGGVGTPHREMAVATETTRI